VTDEHIIHHSCSCSSALSDDYIVLASLPLDKLQDKLLKFVWDNQDAQFSWEYFKTYSDILIDALIAGWKGDKTLTLDYRNPKDVNIDYKSSDWLTISLMEANLFAFSVEKSLDKVAATNRLLPGCKTFNDFKNKVSAEIGEITDINNLRTEYNLAYRTSQQAANYHKYLDKKDLYPYWQYKTQGDSRVREAHEKLNNLVFKADDSAFTSIWPPNGWGCRCYIKPLADLPPDSSISNKNDAENALKETIINNKGDNEWNRMQKTGFDKNRAILKDIFELNKKYADSLNEAKFGIKDNGLPKYKDIKDNARINPDIIESNPADALKWWEKLEKIDDKNAIIKDYNGRPIIINKKTFKNHLTKQGDIPRYNLINMIPDILANPDEVFLSQEGPKPDYVYKYIKYYKGMPMFVICNLNNKMNSNITSWYNLNINNDKDFETIDKHKRAGLLVHKKK